VASAELAIIGSALVIVLLVGIDFGRLFFAYLTITSCARNGAMYGCQSKTNAKDTTGIQNAALADVSSWSPPPVATPTTPLPVDADGNLCVQVQVRYTFSTLIHYPGFSQSWPITRTVQMRVAQNQPN
jgi:hypothetical protein